MKCRNIARFTICSVSLGNKESAAHTPAHKNGNAKRQENASVQDQFRF